MLPGTMPLWLEGFAALLVSAGVMRWLGSSAGEQMPYKGMPMSRLWLILLQLKCCLPLRTCIKKLL